LTDERRGEKVSNDVLTTWPSANNLGWMGK
jgi:hypothetical protein